MMAHPLEQWLNERKQAGQPVKKRDLAKNADCSPSRITQILKGDEPSLALAARLSKATDIPIDKFVKQDEAAQ
jgi:transcriptional regulator with XRE-family HTH domain